jgi:tetratricopeptide (TPR) repeat protein
MRRRRSGPSIRKLVTRRVAPAPVPPARRPPGGVVLTVVLLALAGSAAADPWYAHHDNARRALAAGDWRLAVEEINQAIERRGDSGIRVRTYGMRVADYFPYLTLGIAYHHLGQHDAALEAFETEERLGVVQGSEEASGELERYRALAAAAREEAAAAAGPTAEEILAESLAEARDLDRRGLLDEAMAALSRGLAVAPEDADATALMADLRDRAAARDRARREQREAAENLAQARAHLARGEHGQAAALLRRVLDVRPTDEVRRLLAEAQRAILDEVEAEQRGERIANALTEARTLRDAGRTADALERLEVVFALEPGHAEATALRTRLAAERDSAERRAQVEEILEEAAGHLDAGRFEAALAAANRVLALERGNAGALEVVRRGYAAISRRLLAPGSANVPPAIRFADRRQDLGGELAERVREPDFRLTGVAIDGSPATIAVAGAGGREVAASSASQPVGGIYVTEFAVRERLAPGATVFAVTATDADGLTARSEYTVIYGRPWFRSPWPWASAAVVPVLLAAAVLASRARRRRRLRRRRFNPYIAGGPVFAEELFYGREPLLQRILQTVHTNSLLLHGERRIGKTSILHQLRRRLEALDDPDYRFHPVYVDLQGTPQERFFATLADQVFDALGPPAGDGGSARVPALARPAYDDHDLVRELHGLLGALQQASPKRIKVVLLIDEVDELNDYDPRVNQKLRSLFMKRFAENLVAVVAGVRIRREWEKEASPWYNFFEEIEVAPIAPEDARELVLRPIRGVFRVDPGVAERIVAACGGKPYPIQRRCLALVHRLHEQGRRTITLADVEAVEREGS